MRAKTPGYLAVIVAIAAGSVGAQLRGVVRDSTRTTAIGGAVVTLLDSNGVVLARTLSGSGGDFTLAADERGRSIRSTKIGFSPRDISIPQKNATQIISMVALPSLLSRVSVDGKEVCPRSGDRAGLDLWEQARASLLAAVVAREVDGRSASILLYDRRLVPGTEQISRQEVEQLVLTGNQAFVASQPPPFLERNGYARDVTGQTVFNAEREYFAPDERVLLDESFPATHCFRVETNAPPRSREVGIAFRPISSRDTLVEIEGIVWIDTVERALTSIDFVYTGIEPAARRAGAGGSIKFNADLSGVVEVERWKLRLPMLTIRSGASIKTCAVGSPNPAMECSRGWAMENATVLPPRSDRRQDRIDLEVSYVREIGGQLLSVQRNDGTVWRPKPTGINGHVAIRGKPVPGAILLLAPGMTGVAADRAGGFTIIPAVPGRYAVAAIDTARARCQGVVTVIDVKPEEVISLPIDGPGRVLRAACAAVRGK